MKNFLMSLIVLILVVICSQFITAQTVQYQAQAQGAATDETKSLGVGQAAGSLEPGAFVYEYVNIEELSIPDRKYFPLKSDRDKLLDEEIKRMIQMITTGNAATAGVSPYGVPAGAAAGTAAPAANAMPSPQLYNFTPGSAAASGGTTGGLNLPSGALAADINGTAWWLEFWAQTDTWEDYIKNRLFFTETLDNSYLDIWSKYIKNSGAAIPQSQISNEAIKGLNWNVLATIMIPDRKLVQDDIDALYDELLKTRDKIMENRNRENKTFYYGLEGREDNRQKFNEWVSERQRDILIFGETYAHNVNGGEITAGETEFLISNTPLEAVPYNTVNIVNENGIITPYDLMDENGNLKQPAPNE